MAKLWAVIKREYLERVRTKWFVVVTLFGPLFFAVIMVLPGYLSVKGMREARVTNIRIVDATGIGLGQRVADRLAAPLVQGGTAGQIAQIDVLEPEDVAAAESTLVAAVRAKELVGFLVLDSATVSAGAARYAGRNAGSVGEVEVVESAVRAALLSSRIEAAGIDQATAESLTRLRVRLISERITDQGKGGSGLVGAFFGFGVAFLLYMSIILYGQNVLRGVLEEKTTRVAEVIVSSVSTDTLLAGKVIGVGAVGLTQMLIWVVSGMLFWGQRSRVFAAIGMEGMPSIAFPAIEPLVLVALLLFFILGYTFYASLFAAVGAMVGSQEEAQQASQPVLMLLIFSIIFLQPVMLNPTGRLAEVISWLPFSAPIIMPLRMTVTQVPTIEIIGSLAGLLLSCVAAIWVSARIYRIGLLMYGKRPSLRELGRWIRQS